MTDSVSATLPIAAAAGGIPAAAVVGSQLLSQGLNFLQSNYFANKQFKQNEKLIDKMNEYNSPRAVMERYADAGVNPMFAFDGSPVGQQTSSGEVSQAQSTPFMLNALQQAAQIKQNERALDIQAYNAETNRIKAENEGQDIGSRIELRSAQTLTEWYKQLGIQSDIDLNEYKQALFTAQTHELYSHAKYEDVLSLAKQVDISFDLETWNDRKEDIVASVCLKHAQTANIFMADGTINKAAFDEQVRQFNVSAAIDGGLELRQQDLDDAHFRQRLEFERTQNAKDRRTKLVTSVAAIVGAVGTAGVSGMLKNVGRAGAQRVVETGSRILASPSTVSPADYKAFDEAVKATKLY